MPSTEKQKNKQCGNCKSFITLAEDNEMIYGVCKLGGVLNRANTGEMYAEVMLNNDSCGSFEVDEVASLVIGKVSGDTFVCPNCKLQLPIFIYAGEDESWEAYCNICDASFGGFV